MPIAVTECKLEVGSFTGLRFHSDFASVALHRLATYGQADARTLVLASAVQSLERGEDLLGIVFFDADAAILYPQDRLAVFYLSRQMDLCDVLVVKLQRVADQVLIHLCYQCPVHG
jgi:hypothetical protein